MNAKKQPTCKETSSEADVNTNQESSPKKNWGRRELLKALAATSGAVVAANIPNQWNKPKIEVGVLPAHAQVSDIATDPDPDPDPGPDPSPVYGTRCDSTPGGGDIGPPNTGTGTITNIAPQLLLFSGSGSVDNVPVTMTAELVSGASLPTFTPGLPQIENTNSAGVATFPDLSVNGDPGTEFRLIFTFSVPQAINPVARCGIYRLPAS